MAVALPALGAPELGATLDCPPLAAPGRVRCALALRAPPGSTIAWADALVIAAPSFARPLRSRVGQRERAPGAASVELPLALLATAQGKGRLAVRARAVVCAPGEQGERCRPMSRELDVEVAVGRPP